MQVGALRKAMGRDAIATSYGRGYRLTLDVEAIDTERRRDASAGRRLRAGDSDAHRKARTAFVGRDKELSELMRLLPMWPQLRSAPVKRTAARGTRAVLARASENS